MRTPAVWWFAGGLTVTWLIPTVAYITSGRWEPYYLMLYLVCGCICVACDCGLLSAHLWRPSRTKTDDELKAEQREEEERLQQKRFERAATRETKYLIKRIPDELAIQNRMQHSLAQQVDRKGKRKLIRIKFRDACITQTEVWFPLHSRDFPYGTGFHDLLNENQFAISNLQHGIHRHCRIEIDPKYHHVFLVVSFRNSSGGLPLTVHWSKVFPALAERSRYSVVMGINKSGRVVIQDLSKWPHGLILGGTGNGKTTFMKQAIITLIRRNSPDQLQFVLMDLKEIEFFEFSGLPHVRDYIENPELAVDAIRRVVEEMDRRYDRLKGVCHDLKQWNRLRPGAQMARIFLWCDELARLTRGGDPKRRKNAVAELLKIVARGRAVGIHVLLGTQSVSKEVLPMDVTANIDGRLCYGVRNMSASILAIGNGDAVGLTPPGRGAMAIGSQTAYVQSPIATDAEISESLEMAAAGETERLERLRNDEKGEDKEDEREKDFLRLARDEYNGVISVKKIRTDHTELPSRDSCYGIIRKYKSLGVFVLDGVASTIENVNINGSSSVTVALLKPVVQLADDVYHHTEIVEDPLTGLLTGRNGNSL